MLKKRLRGGILLGLLALLCCLWAGAEEADTLQYEGPIVRNTTEAFPIYASTFSGPAPVWNDAAAFEDGVYEGYYAQLDSVAQLFYDELKIILADPSTAFTSANRETVNVGSDTAPIYLTAYKISVPIPAGVTFPSFTAPTQAQAEAKLGPAVYRHALPALDALGRDHPEMPWLSAGWGLSATFTMTRWYEANGDVTLGVSTGKPVHITLVNPAQTVLTGCGNGTFQRAVDAAVSTLNTDSRYRLSDPGKSDLDKVRAIHDFLCRQIVYGSDGDSSTALDQNAYSALVSPYKTVCAGYTASAKLLCDRYGIPCVNVTGLGGERHAWNYVRMDDGKWYAMDCTWDDATGADPLYDFFLKGSATAVPYGWKSGGVIPFPQSHISTPAWSNYTVMPYPSLSEDDYVGYTLSAAPTAHATYGSLYRDVALTGGEVRRSVGGPVVTGGKWFAGEWTDKDRARQSVVAQESYPATVELPVYFSQNPAFDPIHIYSDPFDYPVAATAALTVDQAPLTIQQAGVSGGTVTKVVFGGLKNGEVLTLGADYTATAAPNGKHYDVTVTLLDTDLARNYVLDKPTFSTSKNNATPAPDGVSVTPTGLTLAVGRSQRLEVAFTPENTLRPVVAWASGDSAVATVDATGLVTAAGAGSTQITVTVPGLPVRSVPVTVTAAPAPTGLALSETAVSLTLDKGETQQLEASILPAGAAGVVRWSSDLQRVATVDGAGLVIPRDVGFAVVTATLYANAADANAKTNSIAAAQCMVSVFENNIPATGVALSRSYLPINVGNTEQLTYTLRSDDVTDRTVFWSSDDPSVATVDATGRVTALSKGTATVTLATATPGVSATCDVVVMVPVSAVTLNVHALDLIAGDAADLAATVTPADTSYPGVTWTSDKPGVATVDDSGHVTAVGPGTATITATAGGGGVEKRDVCTVTVAPEDFTLRAMDVSFAPAAYGYAQPAAKVLTIQSTGNRPATVTSVTVSDPSAFLLSGRGGTVPAKGVFMGYTLRPAAGLGAGTHTATITVAYQNGETAKAKVTFTVVKADADYGALDVSGDALTYGDTLQLTFLPRSVATLMAATAPDHAALYLGDTLLAGPVTADAEGKYVLSYDTARGLVPLGDHTLSFRYGGSADLNAGGKELPIHLSPKALEKSMVALELPAGGYVYDGKEKTPSVTVTDGGRTLGEADYTLTYQNDRNAGTATVSVAGRGWYTGTVERTFSIAPQAGKVVALTAANVPWDVTAVQSLDLAPAVAELALASDTPAYGPVTVTSGGAYFQSAPAVDASGRLAFALSGLVNAPGSAVLTVSVTGLGNYTSVDLAVTVAVVEDAPVAVDLSGLVLADRAYNGQALAYTGRAAGSTPGGAYPGGFTYTWQDAQGNDLPAAPVDAGTYQLLVRTATPGFRGQGAKAVTVTPAQVTVAAGTCRASKVYDGTATPGELSGAPEVQGVLPRDAGVSVSVTVGAYSAADAGEHQVSAALTLTGDGRHNYALAADAVLVPAVITPRSATVTAADQSVICDAPIAQGPDRAAASGLLPEHSLSGVTLTADGQGAIVPSAAAVVDNHGRDVTGNYALTYRPGALTVLPPQVTLARGPVWDGVQSAVTLNVAPGDLLERPGTLIFAARYEDGAMAELVRGDGAGESVTFAADLTARPGWKLFFLDEALAPQCGALTLD